MSRLSKYEGGFNLIHRSATFVNKQGDRIMIKCIGPECWMNDSPIQPDKQAVFKSTVLTHYFRLTTLDAMVEDILRRGYTYGWSKGFNNGNYLSNFVREFDFLQTNLV